MMKRVLVTGGCGYIGSHVVKQLSEQGHRVTVIDNLSSGFKDALLFNEDLHIVDLNNREAVDDILRVGQFDVVMHFAANVAVGESVENPVKYYMNNTFNTLQLIDLCRLNGVKRFVFSSTAAVYGDKTEPVREDDSFDPQSPYGASKMMSERMLTDMGAAYGLRFVILRYFNVAGADPKGRIGQRTPNATHLIKVASEAAVGKRDGMQIFGTDYHTKDGTCIRDYIHVEDLASAHLAAMDYLLAGHESLVANCGYGQGYSVREVIDMVKKVSGKDFKVVETARRPGDVVEITARVDRIKHTLAWEPQFNDLETIVKHAYQWEKGLRRD